MEETKVIRTLFLPANERKSEPVHPAMCSLYYPATRPITGDLCLLFRRES